MKPKLLLIVQRWSNTPTGIMTLISFTVLAIELFIMGILFSFIAPLLPDNAPQIVLNIIDATLLVIAVSPVLYFFIFRRVSEDAEKFLKITSVAQDAVIVMDHKGGISFWNDSAERIFGYSATEVMGRDLHTLVAPQKSLNAFEANFQHFKETGDGPILHRVREVIAQRKSGEQFHAELSVSAMFIDGQWSAVGVVRDISERKRKEETLKERDEELAEANESLANRAATDEAIMESLGEGMIAIDRSGNIITSNRASEVMLGWKKGELIGKEVTGAIPAVNEQGEFIPTEKRQILKTLSSGVASASETINYVKKNDETIPVSAMATPVKINDETVGAVIIFRDITKEQELEVTRRDLLSLASHQLRTPLSGTKWLIETLKNKLLGPLTLKQSEYLDQIYKINENMTELVHDMLDVLRMEGDVTVAKKEKVSLATLFALIFETLNPAAKNKEIVLNLEKSDEYMIETDGLLLRQILECLVSNAINYSPAKSTVVISTKRTPHEFIFSVMDSGIGIPKAEQQNIFQRFYRAENAKTYDTKGTGLGLYIAATIAKKIGARVSFESEEGKGSTFFLSLPTDGKLGVLQANTPRV
ncbi:MAG: PAS domain S-box protein [Candidatus Paceibacterota bacterium]|jgi:PAS domain S-box-containing protein